MNTADLNPRREYLPDEKIDSDKVVIIFVCPTCFTRYQFCESELTGKVPFCDYCNVPLVRNDVQNKEVEHGRKDR